MPDNNQPDRADDTPRDDDHQSKPEEPSDGSQVDTASSRPTPTVGIGASAGGLEALKTFFANMPADSGIGFVVVTHVQPDRTSMLPDLIGGVTDLEVVDGEDGTPIRADRVIVAKDDLLTIRAGTLRHVATDGERERPHHPIDYFFRSLARDRAEQSICIVLSGSGNDGTLGLRSVKVAGGMAMVQDPDSAKYSGMPDSARATGLADYVLPPEELPSALVQYCRGPHLSREKRAERVRLPDDTINAVLVRLRAHTGQDFTNYKKTTMSRRIKRRMAVHHVDEPRAYLRFLRDNPEELDALLQELLISVTSFFRDPEAFDALAEKALPRLIEERADGDTLRVWVPGCATGEEAYSVAIAFDEQIRTSERLHELQIFATDLDEGAIDIARAGVYPEGIFDDMSEERLRQYFSKEDASYRISKRIRDMMVFAVQNVVSDPPFTRIDLIVCRNLLIYLETDAQQRVLANFHYALRPGGLLFLGTSETVGEASDLFDAIDARNRILRRTDTARLILPLVAPPSSHEAGEDGAAKTPRRGAVARHTARGMARRIERVLLDEFAPCAVVVDTANTVVYLHGSGGAYFQPEQGTPKNDVMEMARPGLQTALSQVLRHVRSGEDRAECRAVSVRTNGDTTRVDVAARCLDAPQIDDLVLVTLRPAEAREAEAEAAKVPARPDVQPAEFEDREALERELARTRENLQSTIEELETRNEELQSTNEELQSANEELQSANEELETAKEEMQSLNEELSTVNAELQSKVEALSRANDDMNNLLNSMQVATVFLDTDLRVKRYTEKATDLVRLIGSDVGRPLADLSTSLDYTELIADARQVLASLVPKEKEVADEEGRWHMVRIMPYRTSENVIEGVVMTVVDVDRAKRAEMEASAARDFFRAIAQTVRQPLMVLNEDLTVVMANDAFHRTFATRPGVVDGKPVYKLGHGQWSIPKLRELLEGVLPENNEMHDFRIEHDFPDIGRRTFLLNARRLRQVDDEPDLILLAFEDVTETP